MAVTRTGVLVRVGASIVTGNGDGISVAVGGMGGGWPHPRAVKITMAASATSSDAATITGAILLIAQRL